MMEGSGLKKRGGNIVFFNDVKQLLKKLELIVGEISAGNTSIENEEYWGCYFRYAIENIENK